MSLPWLVSFLALLVGINMVYAGDQQPNIIFILTDDQAEWSLGCYGNKESKSPTLDKLASQGARFTNAFVVTPVCSPSRATMMTGLHSTQYGIADWITPQQAKNGLGLDPALPTWPKQLQQHGYQTALVGKWHLGNQARFHPKANGFHFFAGHLDGGWSPKDPVLEIDGENRRIEGYSVDRTAEDAIRFLHQTADKPFALCIHFREPHTPYVPVNELDSQIFINLNPTIPQFPSLKVNQVKTWTKQYYACVHAIDRNVDRILKKLDELKLAEKTIVIFTSDHGYNIGHHGIHTKGNGNWCTTDKQGVRPNMWDTSLRIPLLIRWPGVVQPGKIHDEWITSEDFYPTLLAMAGIQSPANWKGKGSDFSQLLRGRAYTRREVLFGQYDISNTASQKMRMIRTRDWKLVRHYGSETDDELYHNATDPGELMNCYNDSTHLSIREELQRNLVKWMQSINDPILRELAR